MSEATVTVKCVSCGKTKLVSSSQGENYFPMCDFDGAPMIPIKAESKPAKKKKVTK